MKHKTSELTGADLDAAVALAHGWKRDELRAGLPTWSKPEGGWVMAHHWKPCADWVQAGPIIESALVGVNRFKGAEMAWIADYGDMECPRSEVGPTPLIAAMRAYVASKLGDEVEL